MISGDTDFSRVVASIIPNWPLERLAVGHMRSEIICALLGRARTETLRTFELYSLARPAAQHVGGFADVVFSLRSHASLQMVVLSSTNNSMVHRSVNAWSPVMRWENINTFASAQYCSIFFDSLQPVPGCNVTTPFLQN